MSLHIPTVLPSAQHGQTARFVRRNEAELDQALSLLWMASESCVENQGLDLVLILCFYKGHICQQEHSNTVKSLPEPRQDQ